MDQVNVAVGDIRRDSVMVNEYADKRFAGAAPTQRRHSKDRCRGNKAQLALDALLLPGLGCVSVSKNGIAVIELQGLGGEYATTVADAERLALEEAEQEWRIHMVNLLDDRHFRREGSGVWRLFARGYGLS